LIKEEIRKIIEIENRIKLTEKGSIEEEEKKEIVLSYQLEIKTIRKNIKELNKQKVEEIGVDMSIGFNDDCCIKQELN
jgi:hypothetical protein